MIASLILLPSSVMFLAAILTSASASHLHTSYKRYLFLSGSLSLTLPQNLGKFAGLFKAIAMSKGEIADEELATLLLLLLPRLLLLLFPLRLLLI